MNKGEAAWYQCLEEDCFRPEYTANAQSKAMNELRMSKEGKASVMGWSKRGTIRNAQN